MFRQRLCDEALEDLQSALNILSNNDLDTNWTNSLLSKALDIEPWIIAHPYRLVLRLGRILKASHAETQVPAIAPVYTGHAIAA